MTFAPGAAIRRGGSSPLNYSLRGSHCCEVLTTSFPYPQHTTVRRTVTKQDLWPFCAMSTVVVPLHLCPFVPRSFCLPVIMSRCTSVSLSFALLSFCPYVSVGIRSVLLRTHEKPSRSYFFPLIFFSHPLLP